MKINTPQYRYLVCDLVTDRLLTSLPLTGVSFDRRLSRAGEFKAQWKIANRDQAILADQITKWGGRLAIWAVRNSQLWWGGVLWSAKGSASSRSYDTVDLQAATFESYPSRRYLTYDWAEDTSLTMPYKVMQIWEAMQADAYGDIGMLVDDARVSNQSTAFLEQEFNYKDMVTYGSMIQAYTDAEDGIDYTIDVYFDDNGARTKAVRTGRSFAEIESLPLVLSGFKIPTWSFTRDSVGMGTVFRSQMDADDGNTASDQEPLSSTEYYAQALLDEGWPRLDQVRQVDRLPGTNLAALNANNSAWGARRAGIKDVVQYEVDLSDTQWHPNLIGQPVTIKRSANDLWRPGETATVYPAVVQFTPAEKGQPERVTFAMDDTD